MKRAGTDKRRTMTPHRTGGARRRRLNPAGPMMLAVMLVLLAPVLLSPLRLVSQITGWLPGFDGGLARADLVRATTLLGHPSPERVWIGDPGNRSSYYRADGGHPLIVRGPGVMDLYVRGTTAEGSSEPESLSIRMTGFGKYGDQSWSAMLERSGVSSFGGGLPGHPTGSKKITIAVPNGLQQLILTATARSGRPTYVRAYHDGPSPRSGPSRRVRPQSRVFPDISYPSSIKIGEPGKGKIYYFIDYTFPLVLQGPGYLRMYVRGHTDEAGSQPESLRVVLESRDGSIRHEWFPVEEKSSSDVFPEGIPGFPTDADLITIALPAGRHEYRLTGTSASGRPVYLRAFYNGPRLKVVKKPRWRLDTTVGVEAIYDDNVCRYSRENLIEFRSGFNPDRYVIDTDDDFIVNTNLQMELRRPLLFGKDTRLRGRFQRWTYARNSIKDNHEWQVRFRQHLRKYDYFEASYTYAPDSYIKELRDREPFLSRTVDLEYLHFEITRNAFNFGYRRWINSWLDTKFFVDRITRFYNRPFMENDLWEWNFMTETDIDYKQLTFRFRYEYQNVKARGYDEVDETLETSDNDGDNSYENDGYRLRITYRPKRFPYRPHEDTHPALYGIRRFASYLDQALVAIKTKYVYVQYDYQRRFYTSERPLELDPLHVGRTDIQNQPRLVWASEEIWNGIELDAGVRYTSRSSDAPATVIGEDDPSEEKAYTATRYWLGFTRDF